MDTFLDLFQYEYIEGVGYNKKYHNCIILKVFDKFKQHEHYPYIIIHLTSCPDKIKYY